MPSRLSGATVIACTFGLIATILVACNSAAGLPSSITPSQSAPAPSSSQPPATVDPETPIGTDAPAGGGDPGFPPGTARIVVPKPGQFDVRPISAQTLSAQVDGRRVVVAIDYTSGIEPCYVLDSILVQPGPGSFAITLREGNGGGDALCIEIAEFKRALVDLGELAPGTYAISDATGGASPISITVN